MSQNASIGKSMINFGIPKLVEETADFKEFEDGLGNGCTWTIRVDKKTNTVTSWQLTSSRKPCEEGVPFYGGH